MQGKIGATLDPYWEILGSKSNSDIGSFLAPNAYRKVWKIDKSKTTVSKNESFVSQWEKMIAAFDRCTPDNPHPRSMDPDLPDLKGKLEHDDVWKNVQTERIKTYNNCDFNEKRQTNYFGIIALKFCRLLKHIKLWTKFMYFHGQLVTPCFRMSSPVVIVWELCWAKWNNAKISSQGK